jgi:hypothetical protein
MASVLAVVMTIATSDHSWARASIGEVKDVACRQRVPTDKVTYPQMAGGHQYHIMYGMFLLPMLHRVGHRPAKMLEIGLGCGMKYGAGASALLWRKLFSQTELELWEAEVDKGCVEKHRAALQSQGINVIVGNQADEHTLATWVNATGGSFDAVIDDGSHMSADQIISFNALFDHVKEDGIYVVEDLHTNYWEELGGGVRKPGTFIETTKNLIDELNAYHTRGAIGVTRFTNTAASIHCYDSMVFIEKAKISPRRDLIVGNRDGQRVRRQVQYLPHQPV